ncbi:hypothetical protein BJ875DRAFT_175699 [Amylocarpus encephaloides]|uniref:Uncharacterized protein n=1 Tax=Amylocarpus encephaloides TaxID=45428 RepID=A0A9P8C1G6_9HELO|nr:hypothetical protein BJ875DRAFT_175699 [Amylocarpus encephaloides]
MSPSMESNPHHPLLSRFDGSKGFPQVGHANLSRSEPWQDHWIFPWTSRHRRLGWIYVGPSSDSMISQSWREWEVEEGMRRLDRLLSRPRRSKSKEQNLAHEDENFKERCRLPAPLKGRRLWGDSESSWMKRRVSTKARGEFKKFQSLDPAPPFAFPSVMSCCETHLLLTMGQDSPGATIQGATSPRQPIRWSSWTNTKACVRVVVAAI